MNRRREQAEPEQRRDHRRRHRVGDDRVRRDGAELEEQDRSRSDSARDRHGHDRRRGARQRVALEPAQQSRDDREDRNNGGERELEAGVEQVVRVPREQDERAEEQEPPAIPFASTHPGEGSEPTSDSGANDRRLRPDSEHVRGDRHERADLARHTRDADQPCEEENAARNERDVLARDGEQVVQAGRTEVSS